MADEKNFDSRCVRKTNIFLKRRSKKQVRKCKRENKRRFRRQKSKLRYYAYLNECRIRKRSEELCTAVSVFDLTDMDWAPATTSLQDPSRDVAEWHNREQVAYWKSRAISLEYENRMLHQHIRNVYAKQIEEYAQYMRQQRVEGDEKKTTQSLDNNETKDCATETIEESITRLPPNKEAIERKRKFEEMNILYGEATPKITGMETAVQLNYDLKVDQSNPPYWPHTPLNL